MAKKISAVYRIRNVVSGRYYIGSSNDVYRRFETHKRALRGKHHKNFILQQSWDKHGEDVFKFEVLHRAPESEVRAVERGLLVEHLGNRQCCNLHDETYVYPRTGKAHSPESKAKISIAVQKALSEGRGGHFIPSTETRAKMSASLMGNQNSKGAVRSAENRAAMSERAKGNQQWLGRKHSVESRVKMGRAVTLLRPDGPDEAYTTQSFDTITQLREATGMTIPTVNRTLKSGTPISKGVHKGAVIRYADVASDTET